jgi:hypothetical protein
MGRDRPSKYSPGPRARPQDRSQAAPVSVQASDTHTGPGQLQKPRLMIQPCQPCCPRRFEG